MGISPEATPQKCAVFTPLFIGVLSSRPRGASIVPRGFLFCPRLRTVGSIFVSDPSCSRVPVFKA